MSIALNWVHKKISCTYTKQHELQMLMFSERRQIHKATRGMILCILEKTNQRNINTSVVARAERQGDWLQRGTGGI